MPISAFVTNIVPLVKKKNNIFLGGPPPPDGLDARPRTNIGSSFVGFKIDFRPYSCYRILRFGASFGQGKIMVSLTMVFAILAVIGLVAIALVLWLDRQKKKS